MKSLKKGQKASGMSALISFLLALVKVIIGFLSGSVALISDALHTLADSVVMLASWFGLKISQRKPDKKFPYGYYKAESIATFFISIFILYAAVELLRKGYSILFVLSEINMPFIALIIALASSIISFFVSRYLLNTGKDINSQLLVTCSKERLMDCISSIAVFVAILMSYYKIPYIEGIVAIIISVLILRIGIISIKDSIFALMDVSPNRENEEKIKNIIKNTKGVDDFNNLKLRRSGPFIFGEVVIKIKKFANIERAHEVADEIENKIKKQIEKVDSFNVHVEPYKGESHKIAIPIIEPRGMESEVMKNFGRAEYFLFVNTKKKSIGKFYSKLNPFRKKPVKAGLSTVHFIIKEKVDILVTREIGEISFHTLRDNLVDIYKTNGNTAREVVDNFLKKKLKRIKVPTRREEGEK